MEIVHVDRLVLGLKAEGIGTAVSVSPFHPSTRQPHREAIVVMIPTIDPALIGPGLGHFHGGGPSKFAAPDDESFL